MQQGRLMIRRHDRSHCIEVGGCLFQPRLVDQYGGTRDPRGHVAGGDRKGLTIGRDGADRIALAPRDLALEVPEVGRGGRQRHHIVGQALGLYEPERGEPDADPPKQGANAVGLVGQRGGEGMIGLVVLVQGEMGLSTQRRQGGRDVGRAVARRKLLEQVGEFSLQEIRPGQGRRQFVGVGAERRGA